MRSVRTARSPLLVAAVLGLVLLGQIALWAASRGPGRDPDVGLRQIAWVAVGLVAYLACSRIGPGRVRSLAVHAWLASVALLVAVHFAGSEVNGSRRWLSFGPLGLQPSEIAKVALVLALARALCDRPEPGRLRDLVLPLAVLAVPAALVLAQPDLGTALLLPPVTVAMLVAAGASWRALGVLLAGASGAVPLAFLGLHDYQRARLESFLDPDAAPLAAGYQSLQARVAIGAGRWFGHGLHGGPQTRLGMVPENHTDFVFTAICEQGGLLAATVLIGAYAVLVLELLGLAGSTRDRFGSLLAAGVAALVATGAAMNLGMESGLLPIVGVPLPLVSYGGSQTVATLAALGLAVGACRSTRGVGTRARR